MKSHRSAKPIQIVGASKPTPCADTLHSLAVAARAGDRDQAQRLVNSAIFAAQMVEQLFKEKPALLCEITQKESQVPVLRSRWWWLNQGRDEMAEALQIGEATTPFKYKGVKQDRTAQYIIETLYPITYFNWQNALKRPASNTACEVHGGRRANRAKLGNDQKLAARLKCLSPISKQTAKQWAEAMAYIFLSADSERTRGTPSAYRGTIFEKMSEGLKELHKRKQRTARRLARRPVGIFEERGTEREWMGRPRVAQMQMTQAEMYFGFEARISKRLISMLKE